MVDRRLATHAGIDLRQQRRRNLHKRHAAHVAGSGKAGHIAHHAAAQGKQHRLAVAAVLQQGIKNQVQRLPILVGLPIGQHHGAHLAVARCQRRLQLPGVQRRHGGVGDDHCLRCLGAGGKRGCGGQQALANVDGIGTLAQINADAVQNFCHSDCPSLFY